LLQFLSGPARQADGLWILGDLFEAWIGDDAAGPFEQRIADALKDLRALGVSIQFICGNRDFLIQEHYCNQAGMQLVREPLVIDLHGTKTVLLHGDVLCTDDIEYQRYRQRVSSPDWQQRMLNRPVWLRRLLASLLRSISRYRTRNKPEHITDVSNSAVLALFEQTGAQRMIHGHTHRPNIHCHRQGQQDSLERIVLGDWHQSGSVLRVSQQGAELIRLDRTPA